MDIELLFLLFFFFFLPVLEGVLKKRRGQDPSQAPPRPRSGERPGGGVAGPGEPGERGPASTRSEPAAEMLPDDLWEVLTGERRDRTPGPVTVDEPAALEPEPWERPPGAEWAEDAGAAVEADEDGWVRTGEIGTGTGEASWEDRVEAGEIARRQRQPESLEYIGPEAYSLEQPLPSPEARHAAFHEKIRRDTGVRRRGRRSRLGRALADREGLRKAVLLTEVLGPPKGLA